MEAAVIIILALLGILTLVASWILWRIHQSLKNISRSLDNISRSLDVISDQMTVIFYLAVKNNPDLLEHAPDPVLAQKALGAIERLTQKQLGSQKER